MLTLIDNYGDHITLNIYCCAAFDNNRIEFRLNSFIILVALKRAGFCSFLRKIRNVDSSSEFLVFTVGINHYVWEKVFIP